MRANFQFSKYQACGNDFIIIDTPCSERIAHEKCGEMAKVLCTRHFGIGADSLLYSKPSLEANARMKIFNAQGPEADMCGNGTGCLAAYLCERLNKDDLMIETTVAHILGRAKRNSIEVTTKGGKIEIEITKDDL